ncbi:hypothetical protein [Sphingomonas metalli]|nr:hypothetical protein [Sphingomonas metalli]
MSSPVETARSGPPPSPATIFEAIVKQQAVAASYNRGEVTLAPHVIYTRHDEIYVDAITLDRDGRPPKEEKLGAFKLSGLAGLRITPRRFTPSALFDPKDKRYEGTLLMAVEQG